MMKDRNNINTLLERNLKSEYEPSAELNQRVLQLVKEKKMNQNKSRRLRPMAAAVAVTAILAIGGVTGYAAYKYLQPSQVAIETFENDKLANAFQGENVVETSQQISQNGYTFTLLGLTSGKGLTDQFDITNEEIKETESYAVIAIENADGTKMSEENSISDFLVTPLIGDQNPWEVNIFGLNGFATQIVRDGIYYRIIGCSDLNMFADRGVYIAVCNDMSDLRQGYEVDKISNTISAIDDYNGLNVVFKLPLDIKNADHAKADQILEQLLNPESDMTSEDSDLEVIYADMNQDVADWFRRLDAGMSGNDVYSKCKMIEGTEITIFLNKEGVYKYPEDSDRVLVYIEKEQVNMNGDWQVSDYSASNTIDSIRIGMVKYNDNGTLTYAEFCPVQ